MDEGIKKIEQSIGTYGLWLRVSVMLALAAACLLALRSLQPKENAATASDAGSRDELERMLNVGLPMEFIGIIIQGKVSRATAGDIYQQHHARFEILGWQFYPSTSRYVANIKLGWQPDATPGPGEDFWVIADCSVGKDPSSDFGFKVREASPDHQKACRAYSDVILKHNYRMR